MTTPGAEKNPSLQIAVISLPASLERRAMVQSMLEGSGLPWRFFDAGNGDNPPLPYDAARATLRQGRALTPGEIGCFVSHYRCLSEFAAHGTSADYLLVIEDDVKMDLGFCFTNLPSLLNRLEIDFLMLSTRQVAPARFLGRVGHRSLFRFAHAPYGTQAYLVSQKGARRFTQSIRRIDRPIDDEMQRYWIHGLPIYALFPYPVIELSFPSTVPKGSTEAAKISSATKLLRIFYRMQQRVRRVTAHLLLRGRDKKIERILRAQGLPRLG